MIAGNPSTDPTALGEPAPLSMLELGIYVALLGVASAIARLEFDSGSLLSGTLLAIFASHLFVGYTLLHLRIHRAVLTAIVTSFLLTTSGLLLLVVVQSEPGFVVCAPALACAVSIAIALRCCLRGVTVIALVGFGLATPLAFGFVVSCLAQLSRG